MQISVNGKTLGIAAAVIAVVGGSIGGVVMHKNHKAEMAKKEAALAYANRAIIEQDCVMNGRGQGSCNFTNVGKTEGAICGKIVVIGPGKHEGSKFCSGMVPPMSTAKVEFTEPVVEDLCEPKRFDQSWTDMCDFGYVRDEVGEGESVEA